MTIEEQIRKAVKQELKEFFAGRLRGPTTMLSTDELEKKYPIMNRGNRNKYKEQGYRWWEGRPEYFHAEDIETFLEKLANGTNSKSDNTKLLSRKRRV